MADEEIALLRAKLEASELRHEVKELRSVVAQYQRELKESNTLLLKQRLPPRQHTNSTEKQLIAAGQLWKCAGGGGLSAQEADARGRVRSESVHYRS